MFNARVISAVWLAVWCIPVTVCAEVDLYDMGESYHGFESIAPQANDANHVYTIWSLVRNGGHQASGSFIIRFYASTDSVIDNTDYVIGEGTIPSLGGGTFFSFRFTRAVPDLIPEGSYDIGWKIDPDDRVHESNEDNNTVHSSTAKLHVKQAGASIDIDYYVDPRAPGFRNGSSWYHAFHHIQDALAVAAPAPDTMCVIAVAQGTYTPDQGSGDRTASFQLRDDVALMGGYAGYGAADPDARDIAAYETILSGDLAHNDVPLDPPVDPTYEDFEALTNHPSRQDNSFHVVTANDTSFLAILDGFTIQSGHAVDPLPSVEGPSGCWHNHGGGLNCHCCDLVDVPGNPTIRHCIFRDNVAAAQGGGVHAGKGNPAFYHCTFASNIGFVGGAMSWTAGVLTDHCTFHQNWAFDFGGAINSWGEPGSGISFYCRNCIFTENYSGSAGGAVCNSASADFTDCEFLSNVAGTAGGGLCNDGSVELVRCTFNKNAAGSDGGGVAHRSNEYRGKMSPSLVDCQFHSNDAQKDGGGVWVEADEADLTRCTIRSNHAENGGGIYSVDSDLLITNCQINTNEGTYYGGGVYCQGGTAMLSNCVLWGNMNDMMHVPSPKRGGPGIYAEDIHPLRIGNCTFYSNGSGYSERALTCLSGEVTITNSILWDEYDHEIGRGDDVDITLSYCCVKGGWDSTGSGPGRPGSTFNIDADPKFTLPPDDFTLFAGSPCIDAGANGFVLPDSADLDEDGNAGESTPLDLAGDPRFVDDPFTDDTGIDTPPIVDIGAYEFQEGWPSGACIIFVDDSATGGQHGTSWHHAFRYLQDALALARPGCEIRVAQGTYRPDEDRDHFSGTRDRSATFQLKNGVRIKGGYAGVYAPDPNDRDVEAYETILCGDLSENDHELTAKELLVHGWGADNSYHVVTGSGTDRTAVLDGFTIRRGNASGANVENSGDGGGVFISEGYPTIWFCKVTHNGAQGRGGGIYCQMGTGQLYLNGCHYTENYAGDGGGLYANGMPSLVLLASSFRNNASPGSGGGVHCQGCSQVTVSYCRLSENHAGYEGGGIFNTRGKISLDHCDLEGNTAASKGGGILSTGRADFLFCTFNKNTVFDDDSAGGAFWTNSASRHVNCTFNYNLSHGHGGAAYAMEGSEMMNCLFVGNMADHGGGIYSNSGFSGDSALLSVVCSTFYNNIAHGDGPCLYHAKGDATLSSCILWDVMNPTGPQIHDAVGNVDVTYSTVTGGRWTDTSNQQGDPLFVDPDGPDNTLGTADDNFTLSGGSPCIDAGDNIAVPADTLDMDYDDVWDELTPLDLAGQPRFVEHCTGFNRGRGTPPIVDMGAYEAQGGQHVVYVDDTAPGDNTGSRWRDAFHCLQDALGAVGSGCEIRVAQGTYYPDEGIGVTLRDRSASFTLVDGTRLLGGYAGFGAPDPDLRDIQTFRSVLSGEIGNQWNNGDNSYHVVYAHRSNRETVLDGFFITEGMADGPNSASNSGGGMCLVDASPTVKNCVFSGNHAWAGGGIHSSGNPVISDCILTYNSATYGAGLQTEASPILTNCVFSWNTAEENGGAIHNTERPTLINCTFLNNSAKTGGVIYNTGMTTHPTLINCTLTDNTAVKGASIYNVDSVMGVTVTNCILWGNTPDEILSEAPVSMDVNYSDIQGGWPTGTGNLNVDPRFADSDGRLDPASPCIDTGDNNAVPADVTTDLDGNPRFASSTIDMGAYEFQGP